MMMKLYEKLLNSRLCNVLFNPKYEITKEEYWAGLIVLFLLASTIVSFGAYIMLSYHLSGSSSEYVIINVALRDFLGSLTPTLLPSAFIIFYSSFLLSFKRCKAVGLSSLKWIIGILTSWMFCVPYAYMQMGTVLLGHSMYEQQSTTEGITLWLSIFSIAVILLGIGGILLLSFAKEKEPIDRLCETPYSSIPFTYKIFKLNLVAIFISAILGILTVTEKISPLDNNWNYLCAFLVFVFWGVFIYFLAKRASNAGISPFVPLATMLSLAAINGGMYYIMVAEMLASSPILMSCLSSLGVFLLGVSNVLFFILLVLPSEEVEKESRIIN